MNYFIVRESKRVLAIFDELVNDVDALTCLPDDLSSLSSGDDLAYWSQPHMIATQELIELEKVIRDGTVTSDEVHRHHSLVRNIVDLVRAGDATNDPCRSRDLAAGNSALISFLDTLKIARSTLQRKLSSTAEEERQMLDIVRAAIHREADANADIEAVKRELANEKLTRKQEVQNKDRIIAQLEEELVQLRSNFSVEFDTYQAQVEERDNADAVRYDSEEKTLCETSRTMNSELLALRDKHHKEEAAHRHDRQKKENKVQTVIDVYDAQRTEDTQVIRTANRERREYEELCAKAEKELEELREEHARANLEEETESFRLQHNVEAAASLHTAMRIIQSFYRSYSIRVNLNRKTKGGKKKEKKKK